jgi:hypothetical protein
MSDQNQNDEPLDLVDLLGERARRALGETTRKCGAITRESGQPCKHAPIPGGTRCRLHGGNSAGARKLADARMRELLKEVVGPAINTLIEMMTPRDRCEHCGRSDAPASRTRAAIAILDRTGHFPSMRVEHEVTPVERGRDLSQIPTEMLLQHASPRVRQLFEARMNAQLPAKPVIEAEVVKREDSK